RAAISSAGSPRPRCSAPMAGSAGPPARGPPPLPSRTRRRVGAARCRPPPPAPSSSGSPAVATRRLSVPGLLGRPGAPRHILHGLCTFGIVGHALLRTVCDYAPEHLKSMQGRFTAPVFPGETIVTEIWREDGSVSFRARVKERDKVVLDHGKAVIAA